MTIDYLLAYPDDAAREAAFPYPQDENGDPITAPMWKDGTRTIMPGRIWFERATYDSDGNEVTPEEVSAQSWLAVRSPNRDADIEAMPSCMIATDPGRVSTGTFVVFHNFPSGTELGNFEPVFAGDQYPLMAGVSDDLDQLIIGG